MRETTHAVTAATDAEIQARDRRRRDVLARKGRHGKRAKPLELISDWYNRTYRRSGGGGATGTSSRRLRR